MDEIADRIGLTTAERRRLLAAGAHDPASLHSLIELYPSLLGNDPARQQAALAALLPLLPPGHLEAIAAARAALPPPPPEATTDADAARLGRWNTHALEAGRPPLTGGGVTLIGQARWRLRDQGDQRPTCVAFATAALCEHPRHWAGEDDPDLSEQWLFWAMKRRSPSGALTPRHHKLLHAKEALSAAGICTEARCAYSPATPVPDWDPGPDPGPPAAAEAAASRWPAPVLYDDTPESRPGVGSAFRVLRLLHAGFAVAVALPMVRDRLAAPGNNNWRSGDALIYGEVPDPAGDFEHDGGHAVCILGFMPDAQEPRGGHFLFRNSWGLRFARAAPRAPLGGKPHVPAMGYGMLSATHLDIFCWEMLALAPPDDPGGLILV